MQLNAGVLCPFSVLQVSSVVKQTFGKADGAVVVIWRSRTEVFSVVGTEKLKPYNCCLPT